jgi:hypothetical protein
VFDISRKTGYKIFNRYQDCGLEGLTDRSRRPYRQANQLPFQVEKLIVQLKREKPNWGAPKIRKRLKRRYSPTSQRRPSALSMPCWTGTASSNGGAGAAIRLRERRSPRPARRMICGAPKRIKPGHPEQNGRHERMHLTLKKEATKPAAKNFLQQQGRFDEFIHEYNHERPHQALNMKYPAELYSPSPRPYRGLQELEYPLHDRTITVTQCGRICFGRRKINFSNVFAGQYVGVKEVADKIFRTSS